MIPVSSITSTSLPAIRSASSLAFSSSRFPPMFEYLLTQYFPSIFRNLDLERPSSRYLSLGDELLDENIKSDRLSI